jgi:hypothetical protein
VTPLQHFGLVVAAAFVSLAIQATVSFCFWLSHRDAERFAGATMIGWALSLAWIVVIYEGRLALDGIRRRRSARVRARLREQAAADVREPGDETVRRGVHR